MSCRNLAAPKQKSSTKLINSACTKYALKQKLLFRKIYDHLSETQLFPKSALPRKLIIHTRYWGTSSTIIASEARAIEEDKEKTNTVRKYLLLLSIPQQTENSQDTKGYYEFAGCHPLHQGCQLQNSPIDFPWVLSAACLRAVVPALQPCWEFSLMCHSLEIHMQDQGAETLLAVALPVG